MFQICLSEESSMIIDEVAVKHQCFGDEVKKTFMIFNVCSEIFAVTSMVLQRIISESSMNQQGNISDSEFNTAKTIKIKKIAIEITNVSNMSLQRINRDHRRSSNETSMFRRLGKKTFMIINVCIEIFAVTSSFLRKIIKDSSMNQQWNVSDSVANTKKTITIKKVAVEIINVSDMSLQRIINESSTKQRWNMRVSEVRSIKP